MQFPKLPADLAGEAITFDVIDTDLPHLVEGDGGDRLAGFLAAFAKTHQREILSLDYIFCSDEELHRMNVEYLGHDTFTDIITFDLSDESSSDPNQSFAAEQSTSIEGECYISLDRVRENAAGFGESPEQELLRVIIHGLLHLCGFGDKTPDEIAAMRAAEQLALRDWSSY